MAKGKFSSVNPKQDFIEMERRLLNFWYRTGIVEKYIKKNQKDGKRFSFLDGPITANNPMGVHHAWGRTYKDLWQRFYNMQGYKQRFQNGFDEQGLWVEVEVEKELGFKNKKDIEKFGIDKFVNLCKERVKKFSAIQTEQSKRLGYFMDWDNSYHTSSDQNNYAIWNFLKVCHNKNYLYKGRDSVPWCPRCGTAISQHEILTEEYKEVTHQAVFVKYQLENLQKSIFKNHPKVFLLVWTTTPWTLPSNVAIAINPVLDYGLWPMDFGALILSVKRAKYLKLNTKPHKTFKGRELVGLNYHGNFDELPALKGVKHRIVADKDLVNDEEGTGLVHIAPGAGEEDFKLAQKEKLVVIPSIDDAANYLTGFGDLSGQNAKQNPDLIINKLADKGILFKIENYTHRYPTCWRCKTELVWRVVDEWYIAMDRKDPNNKEAKSLRHDMMAVAKKINWLPKFGLDRELDWLKNMHDWLISKKRYWGLALPIWECSKCNHYEVIGSKEELKERAVEGWEQFEGNSPHRPWIDLIKIKCSQCHSVVNRIRDVGNPWLDAGIVPFSTTSKDWLPADFITESFPGQFKNWFYSLIAMSTVLTNSNPYKTVLGFATLLDEKGEEMHKSKGNAIEFNEAANKIGVDVMRWMYAIQNPANNLLFGYHKADEVRRRFYLILWNVYSFFVTYANLANWDPKGTNNKPQKESILDQWIESRLNSTIQTVSEALTKYDPSTAASSIESFVIADLSTWYVRRSRDRTTDALPTLYLTLVNLQKIIAPFMPYISEEIYKNLTGQESVHLSQFPEVDEKKINLQLEKEMKRARAIVEIAHAKRKELQIKVRQPLSQFRYSGNKLSKEIEAIIASEINVKKVSKGSNFKLDTKITPQLKTEGEAREIIRQIQQARKDAGCNLEEKIKVQLPNWPKDYEAYIKHETLATELTIADKLNIVRG